MIRARLTLEDDGAVCLESTYDPVFVANFKDAIAPSGRQWDPARKRWIISVLYADDLVRFLKHAGVQLQDDRNPAVALTPPPPLPPDLREAFDHLFLAYTAPLYVAEVVYKGLSKVYHPDHGGQAEHFHQINDAITVIRRYLEPQPSADDDDTGIPF